MIEEVDISAQRAAVGKISEAIAIFILARKGSNTTIEDLVGSHVSLTTTYMRSSVYGPSMSYHIKQIDKDLNFGCLQYSSK